MTGLAWMVVVLGLLACTWTAVLVLALLGAFGALGLLALDPEHVDDARFPWILTRCAVKRAATQDSDLVWALVGLATLVDTTTLLVQLPLVLHQRRRDKARAVMQVLQQAVGG